MVEVGISLAKTYTPNRTYLRIPNLLSHQTGMRAWKPALNPRRELCRGLGGGYEAEKSIISLLLSSLVLRSWMDFKTGWELEFRCLMKWTGTRQGAKNSSAVTFPSRTNLEL